MIETKMIEICLPLVFQLLQLWLRSSTYSTEHRNKNMLIDIERTERSVGNSDSSHSEP